MRIYDFQPPEALVARMVEVPASACDEMGRLFRDERLVARVGERVTVEQATAWGLIEDAPDQGPAEPPAARARSGKKNRQKPPGGDR